IATLTTDDKYEVVKDRLSIIRNLRYAPQSDSLDGDKSSDKLLDLYISNEINNKKSPVIIFVHGGGFTGGDKGGGNSILCSKLARQGFAVISINYWLTLKHHKVSGASCTANMSKDIPSVFHPALHEAVPNASNDLVLVLHWMRRYADK